MTTKGRHPEPRFGGAKDLENRFFVAIFEGSSE